MDVILHIGTGRTGTTTIQSSLVNNKQELKRNGIGILESVGRGNNIDLAKFCKNNLNNPFFIKNNILTEYDKDNFDLLVIDKFKNEIKELRAQGMKTTLISSEHFTTDLRTFDEVFKLKKLFDSCEVNVTKIILYIREQVSYLFSEYSNKVVMGLESKYPPPLPMNINTCAMNHEYSIELWSSLFSESEMVIRLFQKDLLKNNNVVSDFNMLLNLSDDFYQSSNSTNFSLSSNSLELMRFGVETLNKHNIYGENRQRILQVLKKYCYANFKGVKAKPTNDFAIHIREKFETTNENIRSKYFIDRKQLFDDMETTEFLGDLNVKKEFSVFIEHCDSELARTLKSLYQE